MALNKLSLDALSLANKRVLMRYVVSFFFPINSSPMKYPENMQCIPETFLINVILSFMESMTNTNQCFILLLHAIFSKNNFSLYFLFHGKPACLPVAEKKNQLIL